MTEEHLFACEHCGGVFEAPGHKCNEAPKTSQQGAVAIIDWMDALHRAKSGLEALLNRDESMNAHELSLACHEAITFIEDEVRGAEGASIGQAQRSDEAQPR